MGDIITFSLAQHHRIFDLPIKNENYFFAEVISGYRYVEEPYRAEGYAICLLKRGTLVIQSGLTEFTAVAPAIVAIGPTVIRSFKKESDDPGMEIVFFTKSFILQQHTDIFLLMKYDFFEKEDLHLLPLDETSYRRFLHILELIKSTITEPVVYEEGIVRSLIYVLIQEIAGLHKMKRSSSGKPSGLNPLIARFRQYLSRDFLKERSVIYYADCLNVTPKHLSDVIKKHTGKTAGKWIDEAITLEAKVLLQNKEKTVAQVSEQLNFSDQSVFGKFFKVNTGTSPLEYRRRL